MTPRARFLRGARPARRAPRPSRCPPRGHALISCVVIVYLKLSGSRLSRRPCAVSDCGYMKKPSFPPRVAPGSAAPVTSPPAEELGPHRLDQRMIDLQPLARFLAGHLRHVRGIHGHPSVVLQ